jgi:TetR/AcrR family fatty acid metabolism transcriptional regulator
VTTAMKQAARRPRSETRELILDAVDTLFGRSGYARMTIEDVAREAGIGKGSIYLHFASKEDLALSSIDRLIQRLLDRLQGLAGSDRPAPERLARMLETRVLYRFDNVNQDSQSLDAMLSGIRTAFLARREGWFEAEAELFTTVLADGAASGELDVEDPGATARLLLTATNSLLPYSLSKLELGRRSLIAERIGRLAGLLLTGLVRRPAARPSPSPETGSDLAKPPPKGPRS